MSSKNLVICDPDEEYAVRLAAFLAGKKELAYQIKLYRGPEQLMNEECETPVHLILVSSEYPHEMRKEIKADRMIVLLSDSYEDTQEGEFSIFKYQPGCEIYRQMLKICARDGEEELFHIRKKGKGRIIGFYSPVHRTGQTSLALAKGREMGKENNVLYLNLETYAGLGAYFPQEKNRNLSTLLYYAKQETGNLGLVLTTLVKTSGDLDYVPPVIFPEDIQSVTGEEWQRIFYEILRTSIYETLILDLGECVQGLYGILGMCDKVFVPTADDRAAAAKLKQFEESLRRTGYGEAWERMVCCDIGGKAAGKDS